MFVLDLSTSIMIYNGTDEIRHSEVSLVLWIIHRTHFFFCWKYFLLMKYSLWKPLTLCSVYYSESSGHVFWKDTLMLTFLWSGDDSVDVLVCQSATVVQAEGSQQLLNGLSWNCVQTFMVPSGWILITSTTTTTKRQFSVVHSHISTSAEWIVVFSIEMCGSWWSS